MDVRRMADQEIEEARELSSQYVMYATPLAWKGSRPAEEELVLSSRTQRQRVLRGTVTRLFPRWGALAHQEGEIFFRAEQYRHKSGELTSSDSLLEYLAVGDALAAMCERMDYLQMAEAARSTPGFGDQRADSLKFMAGMVWQLGSDVDPYAVATKAADKEETFPPFDFLSTSQTLNRQLPAERDAAHRSWPAVVESVHLPAGGTLMLDESVLAGGADATARRVYFHRSRLFLNGVKLASNADLSSELVPGDPCVVDVVANVGDSTGLPPYVYYGNEVPWVATAVQIGTRARGARLGKELRGEVLLVLPTRQSRKYTTGTFDTPAESFRIANLSLAPLAGRREER